MGILVYFLIALFFILYSSIQNQKAKQAKSKTNQFPENPQKEQTLSDRVEEILRQLQGQPEKKARPVMNRRPEPQPETPREPVKRRSLLEEFNATKKRENEQRMKDMGAGKEYTPAHFSETRIVEEYKRQHAQGKAITHHTHNYTTDESAYAEEAFGEKEIQRKKSHPVMTHFKNRKNLRNAFIFSEVMRRKY